MRKFALDTAAFLFLWAAYFSICFLALRIVTLDLSWSLADRVMLGFSFALAAFDVVREGDR